MTPTNNAQAVVCPNCGGQVEFAADQYEVNCKFCGTLNTRERPPRPQQPFVIQTPVFTPTTYIPVASSSHAGAWIGVIIAVVTLAIIGIVFAAVGGSGGLGSVFNSAYAYGTGILAAGGDGQLPDVLLLIHDNNSDKSGLLFASASQKKVLWQNTDFDKDTYSSAMAADATMVFATNKSKLVAYTRAGGTATWQAQLSDVAACADCVRAVGSAVVALTHDGALQAFDGQTGKALWSWRLNKSPDQLLALKDRVGVVDEDSDNKAFLSLFDITTGKEVQHIVPTCVDTKNNESDDLGTDPQFMVDSADQSVYMFYGSFVSCIQRWDLAAGKMLWSTSVDNNSFSISTDLLPLQTTDSIYYNNSKGLIAFDKQAGTLQPLITNADYTLVPLGIKDSTLIIRAKRERGSTRFEVWGLDLKTQQVLWQLPFDSSIEPFEAPDKMAGLIDNTSPGFDAHLTSAGLSVIMAQAEPNKLTSQPLNPQTGKTSGDPKSIEVNATGTFYGVPDVIGWTNDYGYFVIDSRLYIINVVTGDIVVQW